MTNVLVVSPEYEFSPLGSVHKTLNTVPRLKSWDLWVLNSLGKLESLYCEGDSTYLDHDSQIHSSYPCL